MFIDLPMETVTMWLADAPINEPLTIIALHSKDKDQLNEWTKLGIFPGNPMLILQKKKHYIKVSVHDNVLVFRTIEIANLIEVNLS
jgi:hypothetical protein